ncbi:sensor histidine kinase [Streptococcus sp. S784/96/1]|uniref:sensor histidine kinase n=1 Tax=Streptococcus sp. S784/96/1 TaxID=2653499 RepID=UPI00138A4417|nr:histidine kinase [Streptococcus sp. S784/96/1]
MKIHQKHFSLNNYLIKHQLLLIFLPLILLSTLVIGGSLVIDSTAQLSFAYNDLAITNIEHTRSTVHGATNNFEKHATYLTTYAPIKKILAQNYDDFVTSEDHLFIFNEMANLRRQDTAIYSMRVYTNNPTIPSHMGIYNIREENLEHIDWWQKATSQISSFWLLTTEENRGEFPFLTLYQQIPLPLSQNQAVLEIKMDYNYLNNHIGHSNYLNQLFLNNGSLFYSDKFNQIGQNISSPTSLSSTKINVDYYYAEHQTSLLATTVLRLNNQQDTISISAFDNTAPLAIKSNILRWSGILLLFSIAAISLTLYFINFFTKRIRRLHEAVFRVSISDYKFFDEISGHDEISTISLNFHKIVQRIKEREEKIYQSQLHEKELINQQQKMAYSILASQINPHFLFNTLETIRMTALKNQNRDVAHSIWLLAQSMRYTLSNQGSHLTSLKKELDAIDVYSQIQQLRFGERVQYRCHLDDTLDTTAIYLLPLLLQPLVENAISHGLEGITHNGFVTLNIRQENQEKLFISVNDNGIGISSQELKEIEERIDINNIEDTSHIGLKNVHNRIKQYYGDDYGLSISSTPNQGTRVDIIIPLLITDDY